LEKSRRLDDLEERNHPRKAQVIGSIPIEGSHGPGTVAKGAAMTQNRKLYRSRTDRKLAGVCGGLAQYLNTDPTLIRVLFVVLSVLGGSGIVIYLAMWIIVPKQP
jgi:phage shock protein C